MKMYCIFVWEERSAKEGSLGTVQIKDVTPKQREQLLCTRRNYLRRRRAAMTPEER